MDFMRLLVVAVFLSLVPSTLLVAQSTYPIKSSMYAQALERGESVAQQAYEDPAASAFVEPQEFGTNDSFWITVGGRAFQPFTADTPMEGWGYDMFFRTGGSPWFMASVGLPSGVLVEGLEWNVCDSSATSAVNGDIWRMEASGSGMYMSGYPEITTTGETPGCVRRYKPVSTPFVVDNDLYSYGFEFHMGSNADSSTRLGGVRVRVKRLIALAPLTATFNDVSNAHPFYQHIEALVASGITGGCGGGNYCPNDPVTRGQMAVFLAKALGLHWAP